MFEGGTRVPCVVVIPEVTQPGSRSDVIIQSEDFYPTLLESLSLKPAPQQYFDGVSILPALKGELLTRDAVCQYFPHNPGVPDWLPPSVSIHQGDWKLIRIFHGGENGEHRYLLFNLHDDIGEKNNLAANEPGLVAELDARIEQFLADCTAVVPIPNPDFDPTWVKRDFRPATHRGIHIPAALGIGMRRWWVLRSLPPAVIPHFKGPGSSADVRVS